MDIITNPVPFATDEREARKHGLFYKMTYQWSNIPANVTGEEWVYVLDKTHADVLINHWGRGDNWKYRLTSIERIR